MPRYAFATVALITSAGLGSVAEARAQLTLLPAGPQLGTHVGNLVVNGSFESPGPGTTLVAWATGSLITPFGVPPGWTSSGGSSNYAVWGRQGGNRIRNSDLFPDGGNALYFGNGQSATVSGPFSFAPSGEVSLSGPPNTGAPFAQPVVLTQTVNTNLTPAPSYILSFWVSGEGSGSPVGSQLDGIFGLRVTNTQAGDPMRYFAVPAGGTSTMYGPSIRFEFSFVPINPSLPVTIEFTNFGHFSLPGGGTTELVLDDVIVNAVPAPGAGALIALGSLKLARRRR
jgi:hypothetical protein